MQRRAYAIVVTDTDGTREVVAQTNDIVVAECEAVEWFDRGEDTTVEIWDNDLGKLHQRVDPLWARVHRAKA